MTYYVAVVSNTTHNVYPPDMTYDRVVENGILCSVCGKVYPRIKGLGKHWRNVHGTVSHWKVCTDLEAEECGEITSHRAPIHSQKKRKASEHKRVNDDDESYEYVTHRARFADTLDESTYDSEEQNEVANNEFVDDADVRIDFDEVLARLNEKFDANRDNFTTIVIPPSVFSAAKSALSSTSSSRTSSSRTTSTSATDPLETLANTSFGPRISDKLPEIPTSISTAPPMVPQSSQQQARISETFPLTINSALGLTPSDNGMVCTIKRGSPLWQFAYVAQTPARMIKLDDRPYNDADISIVELEQERKRLRTLEEHYITHLDRLRIVRENMNHILDKTFKLYKEQMWLNRSNYGLLMMRLEKKLEKELGKELEKVYDKEQETQAIQSASRKTIDNDSAQH